MKKSLKKLKRSIKRRLDFSNEGRRQRVIADPPAVRDDSIVFVSNPDYTGNPKALFQYMIDHGYNKKYKITWLFNSRDDYFEFNLPNVKSICIKNKKKERTPEAQKALMSAKYVIYSHNVNWCKKYRPEQTFINLWHGSAYKGPHQGDKVIYFDYLMVTGKKFIEVFRNYMKHKDGEIIDLGYPRNEMLLTDRSGAHAYLDKLKLSSNAKKAIIWMPTFRKSTSKRLDSDTDLGETGLPILYNQHMLRDFDKICRDSSVFLIIKQHFLQVDYAASDEGLENIKFLTDRELLGEGVDLYELIGATDAMISDYSSASIDYMLTDKPIGYTLDDFDKYEEVRGWAFDNILDYMPGHHMYTIEDMKGFVGDIAELKDPYRDWRAKVTCDMHTYRDGFSKRILDYFGI